MHSVAGAVLCMMGAQGLDAFSQSGLYSNHQDIGPRYAGVLLGLSNTAGVLAGVLGTAATGFILQQGTWQDVWGVAVALYLVGTLVWNVFSTGECGVVMQPAGGAILPGCKGLLNVLLRCSILPKMGRRVSNWCLSSRLSGICKRMFKRTSVL